MTEFGGRGSPSGILRADLSSSDSTLSPIAAIGFKLPVLSSSPFQPTEPTGPQLPPLRRGEPIAANAWKGKAMRVGEIVYLWIKEGKQKISALMTYNTDQAWSWPEAPLVQEVLKDEKLIPFHFCLDVMYSETSHLADLVLPWTTFLERWDIDARPPYTLIDYVGLRQPVVKPLGESKDVRDIFPELARRIGGGMEQYFPWKSTEEYLEEYFKPVPGGFEYMRKNGVWQDPKKKPNYAPYLRPVKPEDLEGSTTDPATKIIYKGVDPETEEPKAVGIWVKGAAVRGLNTPSRKVEVYSAFVAKKGKQVNREVNPLPIYAPIPDHARELADDQLIMISFKWNVHNAHRTMQSKWLQEIVHSNPAWLNPKTAATLGLKDGDWIEVISHRPIAASLAPHADGSELGRLKIRIRITHGIHPKVLAISHNCGRWLGGPIAAPSRGEAVPGVGAVADYDVGRIWWKNELSVSQNHLMPIYPDPTSGQQAYHDTVVKVRKP